MGLRWYCRAPTFRSPATPTSNTLLFGDRAVLAPLLEELPRLKANSRVVHTDVAIRMDDKPSQALRYGRWKSSMWLAIDAVKKGEADVVVSAGNTGALDGDGALQSQDDRRHRAAGDRGALADGQRRVGRARCRRHDRRRRGASDQSRRHGQRHGARAVRRRAADRRPAQYRRRGGQGPGAGARGRPHPARRALPAFRLSRLRRRRRHRQGHGRCRGDRGLCRQYRAQDRRRHRAPARAISARRHEPHAGRPARLSAWRGRRSARCATRWIRASRTAASSSASTAS